MTDIFVFGSNLAGRHGKGAALHAHKSFGAEYGVGVGRTGNAYAIPTKDCYLKVLSYARIEMYVKDFIEYAVKNQDLTFHVTRVGCGLAGRSEALISEMFKDAPRNCILPEGWRANK